MPTKIIGAEIEPFEHFHLAFLGYNDKLTEYGFMQFVENNIEQIYAVSKINRAAYLKDGTHIKALVGISKEKLVGNRFD